MNNRLTPLLLALSLAAGCGGRYDHGAPIPLARLRQIPETEMQDLPATRLTTAPTTTPTTRATTRAADVSLTLADVRRMAIVNNLDIQVELFNPTIARQ